MGVINNKIYLAMKSHIGDRVRNTEMNDILRHLKITSTGIVKFLTKECASLMGEKFQSLIVCGKKLLL